MKDIQRLFQYHGAEHKVVHTWEAAEELTVENARTGFSNCRLHEERQEKNDLTSPVRDKFSDVRHGGQHHRVFDFQV